MPIKIPHDLPAREVMENENIFVMDEYRAMHQDIRPLDIAILNLMPTKITTETQLIRLLSNSPLQVNLTLLGTASHTPKHTSAEHMSAFYQSFDDVADRRFDGLIITGAPVEELPFEEVDYWPELTKVMDWATTNVYSTLFICWAAQAGLYYHYGIPKYKLDRKCFGVFPHVALQPNRPIMRGFDERFYIPHSRHTEVRRADIEACPDVDLLAISEEAGPLLIASRDKRRLFITGHAEYDAETLANEYFRDKNKGLPIDKPKNYFPDDDDTKKPLNLWRGHAHLLFTNWLNYYVYQATPFDLNTMV